MEGSLALTQLQAELSRLKSEAFEQDGTVAKFVVEAIIEKFPDEANKILWFLVLNCDHGLRLELIDDPLVGFFLYGQKEASLEWLLKSFPFSGKFQHIYEDMVQYGPVGISCRLLSSYQKNDEKFLGFPKVAELLLTKIIFLYSDQDRRARGEIENFFYMIIMNWLEFSRAVPFVVDEKAFKTICLLLNLLYKAIEEKYNTHSNPDEGKLFFYKTNQEYCMGQQLKIKFPTLDAILSFLLKSVEQSIENISVEKWLEFREVMSDGDGKSCQEKLGNLIYHVNRLISKHDLKISSKLKSCFASMEIEPIAEEDTLKTMNWYDILRKINSSKSGPEESLHKWYEALIGNKKAWRNEAGFLCILENYHLCPTASVVRKLLSHICSIPDEISKKKYLESFLNVYKTLDSLIQVELLPTISNHDSLPLSAFAADKEFAIVEMFNRISENAEMEVILKELLVLSIQSPQRVIEKILGKVSSDGNYVYSLQLMEHLKPLFRCEETQSLLLTAVKEILRKDHKDKEWKNISHFLGCLSGQVDENIASALLKISIDLVQEHIESKDFERGRYALKIVHNICTEQKSNPRIPVVLGFLGGISTMICWDAWSFSPGKADLYATCQDTIFSLLGLLPKEDVPWLLKLAVQFPEPVRSNFYQLWEMADEEYPGMDDIVVQLLVNSKGYAGSLSSYSNEDFIMALIKVLPSLLNREWAALFAACCNVKFQNSDATESTFKAFSLALTVFAKCCEERMHPSLENCVNAFSGIFSSLPEASPNFTASRIQNLLIPINAISSNLIRDRCYLLVMPLLVNLLKATYNSIDLHNADFLKYVDLSWRAKLLSAVE